MSHASAPLRALPWQRFSPAVPRDFVPHAGVASRPAPARQPGIGEDRQRFPGARCSQEAIARRGCPARTLSRRGGSCRVWAARRGAGGWGPSPARLFGVRRGAVIALGAAGPLLCWGPLGGETPRTLRRNRLAPSAVPSFLSRLAPLAPPLHARRAAAGGVCPAPSGLSPPTPPAAWCRAGVLWGGRFSGGPARPPASPCPLRTRAPCSAPRARHTSGPPPLSVCARSLPG